VPLRREEGRPKAVRDKVAGKGLQQYSWTEAVQVTNTDDRPDLSSEGAPYIDIKTKCQTEINIRSWDPDGHRHQDGLTDWSSDITWLWLDDRASPYFSFIHSTQTDSGAHPASYPMGTGGRFPRS
jgi:hypothetical protein